MVAHRRQIYSIYHLEQLERESGVTILEPNYIAHATRFLIREDKLDLLTSLASYQEMDLRYRWYYQSVDEELAKPIFADQLHVRLLTDEGPDGSWRCAISHLL